MIVTGMLGWSQRQKTGEEDRGEWKKPEDRWPTTCEDARGDTSQILVPLEPMPLGSFPEYLMDLPDCVPSF